MTTASPDRMTAREQAKQQRYEALLREGARLFADKGFDGVSLEELGAAVGVTGPAVYRHFPSKRALLARILQDASDHLHTGGRTVIAQGLRPDEALRRLISFHTDFALTSANVIRVQDRELDRLDGDERHRIRRAQREYVELWIQVLAGIHPARTPAELRVRAHACFGLLNSSPHSVRALDDAPDDTVVREILTGMAAAALL